MPEPHHHPSPEEIREVLSRSKSIAVVGLSPKKERDSHRVAAYLQSRGYRVIPVNPGQNKILGETCYRSLKDIPQPVDIVNLFLNALRVPPFVDEAVEINAPVVWMQLGIVHAEAALKARKAGLSVIMDRCIMQDHINAGL